MSSNTSEASLTFSENPLSTPSSSREASPAPTASPLEPITQTLEALSISLTGTSVSNPILMPSEPASSPAHEMPYEIPSTNLKSNVKPYEIQENLPPEPRILRVSQADLDALTQVIQEFKDQFTV